MSEKRSPLAALQSIGPAIVIAAVIISPASVSTMARVGAGFGYSTIWILVIALVFLSALMHAAAHVGMAFEKTPCQEIAARLGTRPTALLGILVFLSIVCFQAKNQSAMAAELPQPDWMVSGAINFLALLVIYGFKSGYTKVEWFIKGLALVMLVAFLANTIAAAPSLLKALGGLLPMLSHVQAQTAADYDLLQALVATTFSVTAAFYLAYLVRERAWTLKERNTAERDRSSGILVLGGVCLMIIMTNAAAVDESSGQLVDPIFGIGVAALSTLLVSAMIGGTILSDCLGLGAKFADRWPRHLTAAVLLLSMLTSLSGLSAVAVATAGQALSVITFPALAVALIYLASHRDLENGRKLDRNSLSLAYIGTALVFALALRSLIKVVDQIF